MGIPTETVHFNAVYGRDLAPHADGPIAEPQIFPRPSAKILPRVLVVDDEGLLRWSVAEMLADAGYQVIEARNGRDARTALADDEHPIDVMLVDLQLPDVDGLQLVREARRGCLTCPILVMTAYGSADTLEAVIAAGAHGLIAKPFDLDDMLRAVRQVCPTSPR
jgi:two-component system, NtrC family, response regulator AtoC